MAGMVTVFLLLATPLIGRRATRTGPMGAEYDAAPGRTAVARLRSLHRPKDPVGIRRFATRAQGVGSG